MSLVHQVSGTLVNLVTVALGVGLGLLVRERLPTRVVAVVMQAVGLTTLVVGVIMAWDLTRVGGPPGIVVALIALALGGALGEWARLDDRFAALGDRLQERFRGEGRFTEGFVAASLLFCVGPLTLIGSLQNGLLGDPSALILKATLDGFAALALTTSYGVGVLASLLVIAVYQGGVSLGAGAVASWIADPSTSPVILLINGVGGILIVGLGLRLLDLRDIRVAALLPALALVGLVYAGLSPLWAWLG